jgi:hypothetical protein
MAADLGDTNARQALLLLDVKKSQITIEQQAIGSPFVPQHRFKDNFFDYYQEFVENNKREGNRHLEASLSKFRAFVKKPRIIPMEITENLCTRFRAYLLDNLTGKSPCDYFAAFKMVIRNATKEGYFKIDPADDVESKKNPVRKRKNFWKQTNILNSLKLQSPTMLSGMHLYFPVIPDLDGVMSNSSIGKR